MEITSMKKRPLTSAESIARAAIRKNHSKVVAENGLRWTSNILTEILTNHVGPDFPEAAILPRTVIQSLRECQDCVAHET